MSLLGFPVFRYIDVEDSEAILRAIHLTDPAVPLDIMLHTPGGLVLASLQIARAIHKHKGKVTAFVPHYAMSGGTLIALAADEIVMSEYAVLGRVDPEGRGKEAGRGRGRPDPHPGGPGREGRVAGARERPGVPGRQVPAGEGGGAGPSPLRGDLDARPSDHFRDGQGVRPAGAQRPAPGIPRPDGSLSAAGPSPADGGVPAGTPPLRGRRRAGRLRSSG